MAPEPLIPPARRPRRGLPGAAVLLLSAAAAAACTMPDTLPPARVALGTPAAAVAARSFAAVLDTEGGAPLGAAVAVAPGRAVTNAHVVRTALGRGSGEVRLQRGDGVGEVPARVLGLSPRMDLALLAVPAGFLAPAEAAAAEPARGEPVWAIGPHRLGRALASGPVLGPSGAEQEALGVAPGEGFVARMPALMGFSGGPVVGRDGRLAGVTVAALDETLGTWLLALVAGSDLAGLADGRGRHILVLGSAAALAEAARLDPAALAEGGRPMHAVAAR